jgi:predicted AlkP superfamily pyrophosphatase or phosphodiesterase
VSRSSFSLLPLAWLGLALLATTGCAEPEPPPPPEDAPGLVLFVVVDQFRGDYLDRFSSLWTGALAELSQSSVVFTEAHHRHANTSTGPGHATLSTGAHPARHGIVANSWYDRETGERVYCVEDDDGEVGPGRLLVETLGDHLKARWPASKVWSAGGKDRSAVLMGGHRPDGVLWYDRDDGGFTTGGYYEEPSWLGDWNGRRPADRWFGVPWEPLPETTAGAASVGVADIDRGAYRDVFPHALGNLTVYPAETFYEAVYDTPVVDELLLDLARRLVAEEGLGRDDYPDLLALSFSAADSVGHSYGPDSPELLDTLLRLDRGLGELLDWLEGELGEGRVAVVLSSDHGVVPLPEVQAARGLPGRRVSHEEVLCYQRAGRRLHERFGDGRWLVEWQYLNPSEADGEPTRDELADAIREEVSACPGILHVWTAGAIEAMEAMEAMEAGEAGEDGPYAELYAHGHHPRRSPDLYPVFEEDLLMRTFDGTTHGGPHRADTHVPWLLRWPGLAPRRVDDPVATVDVAPTLGALLGLPPFDDADGRVRLTPP